MSARRRPHTARSPVLDLVRGLIYVLLPIALVATIVFMAQGALETLAGPANIHDALSGASQVSVAIRRWATG
jgi:potassium-transporting ATPase potassium-binding subunit